MVSHCFPPRARTRHVLWLAAHLWCVRGSQLHACLDFCHPLTGSLPQTMNCVLIKPQHDSARASVCGISRCRHGVHEVHRAWSARLSRVRGLKTAVMEGARGFSFCKSQHHNNGVSNRLTTQYGKMPSDGLGSQDGRTRHGVNRAAAQVGHHSGSIVDRAGYRSQTAMLLRICMHSPHDIWQLTNETSQRCIRNVLPAPLCDTLEAIVT